jgi:hypothetical protein
LLGNEPVRRGDLRTQNGILRQVSLVVLNSLQLPSNRIASRSPREGEGELVAPAE